MRGVFIIDLFCHFRSVGGTLPILDGNQVGHETSPLRIVQAFNLAFKFLNAHSRTIPLPLRRNQRPNLLAQHHRADVAMLEHVEDYDRHLVVHAERERG